MVFVGVISCDATSAWWHPSSNDGFVNGADGLF
jgi:hypothetical protein